MTHDSRSDREWRLLRRRLPPGLEESARACGALVRRREVKSAADLLRLAFVYGPGGLSLRETSAWAELVALAELSPVAAMKRLRHTALWLEQLTSDVLARRAALAEVEDGKPRMIRLIDGSVLQAPGTDGIDWRLHVTYDLGRNRLSTIELTDRHGAEKLERAPVVAGEIRVGDRCYARAEGLRYILDNGGDFVVRLGARSLKLLDLDGRPFSLRRFLVRCRRSGQREVPVLISKARGRRRWQPVRARLIAIRKPPQQAARSRRLARRASQKNGQTTQTDTLLAADYLLLITSLPASEFSATQVAAIYRLRWQIELAIKRLKSLLHIDRLPAKDPDLAKCWLYSHLLLALLLEDLSQDFLDSPPCAPESTAPRSFALAHNKTPAPLRPPRHPASRRPKRAVPPRCRHSVPFVRSTTLRQAAVTASLS
jgi:IS4 transposase